MIEELVEQLSIKEKHLQLVNSLISLQNNTDYKVVFEDYLFKDEILNITSKLRFGSEIQNNIYLKQLESLTELKLLIKDLSRSKHRTEIDITEIKQMIENYMFGNTANE
jgi:hypothetical protein